jgi:hypothetical protein
MVTEQITAKAAQLPPAFQQEALDFIEFLARKAQRRSETGEDAEWSGFSLGQAIRGLEDEAGHEYQESDLQEEWQ